MPVPAHSRVLIVEDSLIDEVLLRCWLEQSGAHLSMAGNLAEAQQLIAAGEPFSHAMLDIQLPDGLGSSLVSTLRETGCQCIIAMTSFDETTIHELAGCGFDYVLDKPIDYQQLLRALQPHEQNHNSGLLGLFEENHVEEFNLAAALERFGGEHSLYQHIVQLFLQQWPQHKEAMLLHITEPAQLVKTVQTVIGLISQVGFTAVVKNELHQLETKAALWSIAARFHHVCHISNRIENYLPLLREQVGSPQRKSSYA